MDDPRSPYKQTVLRILGSFQLLEFALKAYIGRAYRVIAQSVHRKVSFDYSQNDVESFPLERLVNTFAKLNDNKDLIQRLNALREKRNHIAHRSLLITFGAMYDRGEVEDRFFEFVDLEDELTECLNLLISEAKALKERSKNHVQN